MFNFEKLQNEIKPAKIIYAHTTGATLYSTNPRDEDFVVVVDNWDQNYRLIAIDGVDYFVHSRALFEKKCRVEAGTKLDLYAIGYSVGETVYGEPPLGQYDFLQYKERAVKAVLKYGQENFFNPHVKTVINGTRYCGKQLAWAYMVFFAIQNNSAKFTSEQKAILQKCHDRILPYENAVQLQENLQQMLEALKNGN